MQSALFKMPLYLPAQGASEIEVTVIEWHVAEGDTFRKGQVLAQIDSAKSVFDFEAPCDGVVLRRYRQPSETLLLTDPILEIETDDPAMRDWIPPAVTVDRSDVQAEPAMPMHAAPDIQTVAFLGFGGYLPDRVVTNDELVQSAPDVTPDYIYQVTGIRERRWAGENEKPSDMAYRAALDAIRHSDINIKDIDAIIIATTTPDKAMPSTAAILQDRLNLPTVPAFDLNAACSGWLYAVGVGRGLILGGTARNVLAIGVDMQSRFLDPADRSAYYLFGDGAGAAVLSARSTGHRIRQVILGADTRGLDMAYRNEPGYFIRNGQSGVDPWIRIDGPALFRMAAESFTNVIRQSLARTGWRSEDMRYIIPHQANGRILKAAAKRSGMPYERFYVNVAHVGNTSSASVPLAITEVEHTLNPGDKLVLCSVGAGMTTAAISVEW